MKQQSILIVEDDVEIADLVTMYLEAADYKVKWFDDGIGAVEWVQENQPDLILLDLDLPVKQGLDVCKEVRLFSEIPIIMTTAKVEEVDRLIGLDIGADDYVCKPYSIKELVARVKANLRRFNIPQKLADANDVSLNETVKNELLVDCNSYQISLNNRVVELTTLEFNLFYLLYSHANRIYSRNQIMDLIYPDDPNILDRTVDSHIRNLRKKLKLLPLENDLIRSIYGAGYKFEPI